MGLNTSRGYVEVSRFREICRDAPKTREKNPYKNWSGVMKFPWEILWKSSIYRGFSHSKPPFIEAFPTSHADAGSGTYPSVCWSFSGVNPVFPPIWDKRMSFSCWNLYIYIYIHYNYTYIAFHLINHLHWYVVCYFLRPIFSVSQIRSCLNHFFRQTHSMYCSWNTSGP